MLQAAVLEMAGKIASKSSMTLATGKRAFYAQREMSLSQAYDYASQVMVDNMMARDAEEGIGAFIEKRQPRWQDA
jgi:enoyl-CoA hydratase/carnithine racemase